MKVKSLFIFFAVYFSFIITPLYIYSIKNSFNPLIFPNPFEPQKRNLQVKLSKTENFNKDSKLRFIVYDLNFNKIYEDSSQKEIIYWSGYDRKGQPLPPQLYYILIIETQPNGSIGSSISKLIIK